MEIKSFLDAHSLETVQITDKVKYNVRDIKEKVIRLRHAQFEEPLFPDKTRKKFYRVAFAVANLIYRNTDLDTKDVQCNSTNGWGIKIMPLFKMALQWWMKVMKFGTFMNDVRQEIIDMGHVIIKVVNGKPQMCNPLNIIVPGHVNSLHDSGLVEATFLTFEQMEEHKDAWKDQWVKIEELKRQMDESGQIYFTVYEHWKFDEFKKKKQKGCIKYLDTGIIDDKVYTRPENWQPYEELERFPAPDKFTDPLTGKERRGYPYVERGLIKLPGRYWRLGVYELLADLMEEYNDRMNRKSRLDQQTLTGVLLHKLPSQRQKASKLTSEFLHMVDTGAVLDVESDEDLRRLDTQVIPDFIAMIDKIFELMRIIIGATGQGSGEDMPANQPATNAVLNQKAAQTTYDVVIEEESLLFEELFQDFLMKVIIKQLCSKKIVPITGDPTALQELDNLLAETWLNNAIADFQTTNGVPGYLKKGKPFYFNYSDPLIYEQEYNQELQSILEELKSYGDMRLAEMADELFKQAEFSIKFNLNNEGMDKRATIQDLLTFRQIPDLTLSKSKLDEYMIDLSSGLDARRFQKSEQEKADEAKAAEVALAQKTGMMPNAPMQTPGQEFAGANTANANAV